MRLGTGTGATGVRAITGMTEERPSGSCPVSRVYLAGHTESCGRPGRGRWDLEGLEKAEVLLWPLPARSRPRPSAVPSLESQARASVHENVPAARQAAWGTSSGSACPWRERARTRGSWREGAGSFPAGPVRRTTEGPASGRGWECAETPAGRCGTRVEAGGPRSEGCGQRRAPGRRGPALGLGAGPTGEAGLDGAGRGRAGRAAVRRLSPAGSVHWLWLLEDGDSRCGRDGNADVSARARPPGV